MSSFAEPEFVPPLQNKYDTRLHAAYKRLLDETSLFVVSEQKRLSKGQQEVERTVYAPGELVLVSYITPAPSKLHARWAGPFEVTKMEGNNLFLRNLTGSASREVDVSRV